MKLHPVGKELLHVDVQTGRHDEADSHFLQILQNVPENLQYDWLPWYRYYQCLSKLKVLEDWWMKLQWNLFMCMSYINAAENHILIYANQIQIHIVRWYKESINCTLNFIVSVNIN